MKTKTTTIKVHSETVVLLKTISDKRGRRESMEQVILELINNYIGEYSVR